jgi:aerobic carbon-monoxide dehydrogenase medium subunit
MKAAAFDLRVARSLDQAIWHLSEAAGEGKILAGGQSLAALMAFRLARPEVIVDINSVAELASVRPEGRSLAIGALTRQRTLERDALVARDWPLLAEAIPHIAHEPIRNRGTIGGSVAHADPSAELPMICLTLDARMRVRGPSDAREVAAADFFLGPFTTALGDSDVLTEIVLPVLPDGAGTAFCEVARRRGDFAMVAVAAVLAVNAAREITFARLGYASMGATPLRALAAENELTGAPATAETFERAAAAAAGELHPGSDVHASADFRRHLADRLTRRALGTALSRALRLDA